MPQPPMLPHTPDELRSALQHLLVQEALTIEGDRSLKKGGKGALLGTMSLVCLDFAAACFMKVREADDQEPDDELYGLYIMAADRSWDEAVEGLRQRVRSRKAKEN